MTRNHRKIPLLLLQQWPELAFTRASACLGAHVLCVDYKQAFVFVDSTHSFPDNMSTRMSNKRNIGARTRKKHPNPVRVRSAKQLMQMAKSGPDSRGSNADALFFCHPAPVVKIDCSPERCGQKERESSSRVGVNPRVSQISPPINLWPRYQKRAHKQHFFSANARGDDISTARYINNAKCNCSDVDIIIIYFYNGSCRHYGALYLSGNYKMKLSNPSSLAARSHIKTRSLCCGGIFFPLHRRRISARWKKQSDSAALFFKQIRLNRCDCIEGRIWDLFSLRCAQFFSEEIERDWRFSAAFHLSKRFICIISALA